MIKKITVSVLQALLATVVLLLVLEAGCRILGMPRGASRFTEAVIIRNHLSASKPAGEFRVFLYGESSIHGSHYWPFSNPARWLEVYLHDFLPGKNIKVVNFGRMGQGSFRTSEAVRATLDYKPDLTIFYMGHNTFLPGDRKKEVLAKENKSSAFWRRQLQESRFFSLIYRFAIAQRIKSKKDAEEEDSIEYKVIESDPWGFGPENIFPNNSEAYRENIEFFKQNLEKITELVSSRGIALIFCKPAGNLKDFSPFVSLHLKPLSPEDETRFSEAYEQGKKAQASGLVSDAVTFFERAYAIDTTYADLNFQLATLYFRQGELEKAKKLFEEARDFDGIKVRATADSLELFDQMREKGITVVDTEKAVISEAPGGILGEPVIEDNVHLSIKGHALLGRALAQTIAEKNWIAPLSEWHFDQERSFDVIAKELGVDDELLFSADLKMVSYFGSRYDNRIRFAEKALAIHPDDPKALRHLAWSYWLKGDSADALDVYRKLSGKNPEALTEVFGNKPEIKKAFAEKFPALKV